MCWGFARPPVLRSLISPSALFSPPSNYLWPSPASTATSPNRVACPMLKLLLIGSGLDLFTSSMLPDFFILFLPSGNFHQLFPSIRWQNPSTHLLSCHLSLSPPVSQRGLSTSFYVVCFFFWCLTLPLSAPGWFLFWSVYSQLNSLSFSVFFRWVYQTQDRLLDNPCPCRLLQFF